MRLEGVETQRAVPNSKFFVLVWGDDASLIPRSDVKMLGIAVHARTPALGIPSQADLEKGRHWTASLVYLARSRPVRPCLRK